MRRRSTTTQMAIEELQAAIENAKFGDATSLAMARTGAIEAARLLKAAERETRK